MKTKFIQEDYSANLYGYQLVMPLNLEVIIPADDSVRLLSQILDELNYSKLDRAYAPLGRKAAVEPRILFKVMVYAYHCGIYSSRAIESACRRDINFRWLLAGAPEPSKSTIASFRAERLSGVAEDLFGQLVRRLEARGEIGFENLFVDGTKIEANANRYSFVWRKTTEKHQAKLEEMSNSLLAGLNEAYGTDFCKLEQMNRHLQTLACDTVFVHGAGKRKTQLQRDVEETAKILEKQKQYRAHLNTMGKRNSYSKTDHDATFMRMKEDHLCNGQLKAAYNVQMAVESEYVVGVDISSERDDKLTLKPLLARMEQNLWRRHRNVIADAGYESEENYAFLEERGQMGFIKPQSYEQSKKRKYKSNLYRVENMPYDPTTDSYTCPDGKSLRASGTFIRKSGSGYESTVTRYTCESCEGCEHRPNCFSSKYSDKNREITTSKEFQRLRASSLQRITSKEGVLLRVNRSIQSEGVFAMIKEDYAFRRFLTRGTENVRTEMLLMAMGCNIFKLHCKIQKRRTRQWLFGKYIA